VIRTSGGSSHRLESRKLEPFLDFGGRARESSLLSKTRAYLGLVFHLIRDFPIDFGNKTPEKTQKTHNLYTKKSTICMFFELLLSNEPFYIFLGSDSIHGSSDSFFSGQKAWTRSSLNIRDSTRHYSAPKTLLADVGG
jgi:hypothetical protein